MIGIISFLVSPSQFDTCIFYGGRFLTRKSAARISYARWYLTDHFFQPAYRFRISTVCHSRRFRLRYIPYKCHERVLSLSCSFLQPVLHDCFAKEQRNVMRAAVSSCVTLIPYADSICKWRFCWPCHQCGVCTPLITSINVIDKKVYVSRLLVRDRSGAERQKGVVATVTLPKATSQEERFSPRRDDKRIAHATGRGLPEIDSVGCCSSGAC